MRIFQNKRFARFARQEGISDQDLCEAITRAERGLIDADLGGGVIKQRIARPNEGRSGGFRSIVVFRVESRAFFVYGFAKNERDNIKQAELKALKQLAQVLLAYTEEELAKALKSGALTEVICNEQDV